MIYGPIKKEPKKIAYSLDNERYFDIQDILEMINELTSEYKQLEHSFIYIGDKIELFHKDFFNVDNLVESITDAAYEESEDYSDNYISQFTDEKKKDLSSLVLKFLNENINQPDFFHIENIKQLKLKDFLDNLEAKNS